MTNIKLERGVKAVIPGKYDKFRYFEEPMESFYLPFLYILFDDNNNNDNVEGFFTR